MVKRILFVCLGNICRSPAAEGVFLDLLKKNDIADKYYVDSAGTSGWHVGSQADKRMRTAAQRRGLIIKSIARQVSLDDLQTLAGVGRKTANVIGSVFFDIPTMPVDTHVFRVSERIGLTTKAKNPLQAELQLLKLFPKEKKIRK